ncbi:cysteine dioxygenase, partial [Klebsiella pneumoniae]|nr:cysteine dioxygenase [Klebsiella pneumoniae]
RSSKGWGVPFPFGIHSYGGNSGAVNRPVYPPEGQQKPFISGYSNRHLPNIWDSSREHQG